MLQLLTQCTRWQCAWPVIAREWPASPSDGRFDRLSYRLIDALPSLASGQLALFAAMNLSWPTSIFFLFFIFSNNLSAGFVLFFLSVYFRTVKQTTGFVGLGMQFVEFIPPAFYVGGYWGRD